MSTKLTELRRKAESSKNVKTVNVKDDKEEKQPVTFHLPRDVVEHLMLGKARKLGSMSDQVTKLVRATANRGDESQKEQTD